MKKFVLTSLVLALALLVSGMAWADAQASYPIDGLVATRSLHVREIGHLDFSTGAVSSPWYESTVTLGVKNSGPTAHTGIVLEENLAYLPANVRLAYSVEPSSVGHKAAWSIPYLASGEQFLVNITVMALVPDSAIGAQGPPGLEYARPIASLQAPQSIDQSGTVVLRLLDRARQPIPSSQVEVSAPDGRLRVLTTDPAGYARFDAPLAGIYTYRVPAYTLDFIPSTQSLQPAPVIPPTTGAMVGTTPPPQNETDLFNNLLLAGVILIGLVLAAFIGLVLLGFLSRSGIERDSDSPPDSPRAVIEEDSGIELRSSRSTSGARGAVSSDEAHAPPAGASSAAPAAFGSPPAGYASPVGASYSISSSTSTTLSGSSQDAESLSERTRRLVASRRGLPASESEAGEAGPSGAAPEDSIPSTVPSSLSSERGEDSDWTESTTVQDARAPVQEAKPSGSKPNLVIPTRLVEEFEAASRERRAPSDPESDEDASDKIDDEAIRKTIEELEQLRAELAARSPSGARPDETSDEQKAEAKEQENTETMPEEDDGPAASDDSEEPAPPGGDAEPAGEPEPIRGKKSLHDIDLGRLEREEEEDLTQEGISIIDPEKTGRESAREKKDLVQKAIDEITVEEAKPGTPEQTTPYAESSQEEITQTRRITFPAKSERTLPSKKSARKIRPVAAPGKAARESKFIVPVIKPLHVPAAKPLAKRAPKKPAPQEAKPRKSAQPSPRREPEKSAPDKPEAAKPKNAPRASKEPPRQKSGRPRQKGHEGRDHPAKRGKGKK